jgi:hypothetical protein
MGKRRSSPWSEAMLAEEEIAELRLRYEEALSRLSLYEGIRTPTGREIPSYKPTAVGNALAIAMLSDVHLEERVDPEDVPGTYNVYNPQVCRARLDQFAQRVCLLTEAQRHLTQIDDLCLFIGGDIRTGTIHEDQAESNWLNPMQTVIRGVDYLTSVIQYILKNGNFKRIIIPCCFGNHGRLTKKPRAKTAAGTSIEWMMYQFLANYVFKDESRVQWHIADAAMVYVDLYGFTCRFTHGDKVNYQGGVGGINVPIQRMVKNWNRVKDASYTFMGHFHQASDFGNVVVNGSLIGPNAYSLENGFPAESPKQQYVLIDQRRGKSLVSDIWCDYLPNKSKE